jgi:hypothetical protein
LKFEPVLLGNFLVLEPQVKGYGICIYISPEFLKNQRIDIDPSSMLLKAIELVSTLDWGY